MATLAQGQAVKLHCAISQKITVTPSTGGRATISANGPGNVSYAQKTISAAETFGPYLSDTDVVIAAVAGSLSYDLGTASVVSADGNVLALSEVSAYVAATPSAGATVFTGACEYAGYICTTAAGNITVYDGTSTSGRVIVPTTALVLGAFPIFGAGTNGKLALTTGCHVVLSGAGAVNVAVG